MTAPPSPRPLHEAAEPSLLRVEVIQGTVNPAWPAVVALRERVFGGEQGIAEATASDPDDARSLHAVAWLETSGPGGGEWRLVGTGRITLHHGGRDEALIAWVATAPEARRRGVATAVMGALLAEADAAGVGETLLAAQRHAEGFYGRLGFFAAGAPYAVHGIPHRWMTRQRRG
jgi:predicted GNAT family N-acyltransferase